MRISEFSKGCISVPYFVLECDGFNLTSLVIQPILPWSSSKSKSLCIDCPFGKELKSPPRWLQVQLLLRLYWIRLLSTASPKPSYIRSHGNCLWDFCEALWFANIFLRKHDLIKKGKHRNSLSSLGVGSIKHAHRYVAHLHFNWSFTSFPSWPLWRLESRRALVPFTKIGLRPSFKSVMSMGPGSKRKTL